MSMDITYGPGGYDPDAPNNNIVAETPSAPPPEPTALELLAAMPPEQLRRVLELGVALTEPAAVETLTAAVAADDPTTGVAVVAQAAEAAAAEPTV